jgi:hypothetical protein
MGGSEDPTTGEVDPTVVDPKMDAQKFPNPDPVLESQEEEDDPPFRTLAPSLPLSQRYTELRCGTSINHFPYGMPDVDKYGKILATLITYERVREVSELDELRQNLMTEAAYIANNIKELI